MRCPPSTHRIDSFMGFAGVLSCSSLFLWERRAEAGGHSLDPTPPLSPLRGFLGLLSSALEEKAAGGFSPGACEVFPPWQAASPTQSASLRAWAPTTHSALWRAVLAGRPSLEMKQYSGFNSSAQGDAETGRQGRGVLPSAWTPNPWAKHEPQGICGLFIPDFSSGP